MTEEQEMLKLVTMSDYPCKWDELFDEKTHACANVYSRAAAEERNKAMGVTECENGIFDIGIDAEILTKELVSEHLKKLTEITGVRYIFE